VRARILFLIFYFYFYFIYILLYARFVSCIMPVSCPGLGNSSGISCGNRIGFKKVEKARKYQVFLGLF